MPDFYEFFAGGGMARAGLGPGWTCLFANDIDLKKARNYELNWGAGAFVPADVKTLISSILPGQPDLVWASFPCQDLSLAGVGAGLQGERSGTFWPFWRLMKDLIRDGRAPDLIALENVCGALTSHGGHDFAAICSAFEKERYRCGAMVVDADLFVPQSRPRLFVIGARSSLTLPKDLDGGPSKLWHTPSLRKAFQQLPSAETKNWIWWRMPEPPRRTTRFADLIEDVPTGVEWHSKTETERLLSLMNERHLAKVEAAKRSGGKVVGTLYRRTRTDANGAKAQRAEVRFDDVAGCLRTPAGGSSRQLIMVIENGEIRTRLISSRETARLMGIPDSYILPKKYNAAYHLTGDGVVVPVVRHIAEHILEPVLACRSRKSQAAA